MGTYFLSDMLVSFQDAVGWNLTVGNRGACVTPNAVESLNLSLWHAVVKSANPPMTIPSFRHCEKQAKPVTKQSHPCS
jgi:hypothetical protein